tara:strand:+ start:377 stop:673 length:297 start_codon:yes stop_codon:yes gene_type:complete
MLTLNIETCSTEYEVAPGRHQVDEPEVIFNVLERYGHEGVESTKFGSSRTSYVLVPYLDSHVAAKGAYATPPRLPGRPWPPGGDGLPLSACVGSIDVV